MISGLKMREFFGAGNISAYLKANPELNFSASIAEWLQKYGDEEGVILGRRSWFDPIGQEGYAWVANTPLPKQGSNLEVIMLASNNLIEGLDGAYFSFTESSASGKPLDFKGEFSMGQIDLSEAREIPIENRRFMGMMRASGSELFCPERIAKFPEELVIIE